MVVSVGIVLLLGSFPKAFKANGIGKGAVHLFTLDTADDGGCRADLDLGMLGALAFCRGGGYRVRNVHVAYLAGSSTRKAGERVELEESLEKVFLLVAQPIDRSFDVFKLILRGVLASSGRRLSCFLNGGHNLSMPLNLRIH